MIGIYLSGTGNTKHCVEKLVSLLDAAAECIPLEAPHVTETLEKQSTIILDYPTQFSNAPFMVRDFIRKNRCLWNGKSVFCLNTMCYRCISLCPHKAITLLGDQVQEQCRYLAWIIAAVIGAVMLGIYALYFAVTYRAVCRYVVCEGGWDD